MVQFVVGLIIVLFILGKAGAGGKGIIFTFLAMLIICSFVLFPSFAVILVIATVVGFLVYLIRR